jgi:hypothetical protein
VWTKVCKIRKTKEGSHLEFIGEIGHEVKHVTVHRTILGDPVTYNTLMPESTRHTCKEFIGQGIHDHSWHVWRCQYSKEVTVTH